MLRPTTMYQHPGVRRGKCVRFFLLVVRAQAIHKAIGRFSPLQRNIRTMVRMESNEPTIQCQTLGLQHTDRDLNARLLQFPNAPTRHFGKRIHTPDYDTGNSLFHNQIGTRRRLSIMRARLQTYVYRTLFQQFGITHRTDRVHLGMRSAATHVVSLADNLPVVYNDSPHHRIRCCAIKPVACQLYATGHVFFVCCHIPIR